MCTAAEISDIESALMNKEYESVKDFSNQIIRNSSDHQQIIKAQYYLGLAQLRLGQYAEGRRAFHTVMQADHQDLYDKAAVGLMEGLAMAGLYKDVVNEANKFISRRGNSPVISAVYLKLARGYLKLSQWNKAKESLLKIINDFNQSPEVPLAKHLMEEKQYFAVQVGSFEDKNNAVDLINILKSGGYYAYIIETDDSGRPFFRVRVGQMTSLPEAQDLQDKLANLGYPTLIYP